MEIILNEYREFIVQESNGCSLVPPLSTSPSAVYLPVSPLSHVVNFPPLPSKHLALPSRLPVLASLLTTPSCYSGDSPYFHTCAPYPPVLSVKFQYCQICDAYVVQGTRVSLLTPSGRHPEPLRCTRFLTSHAAVPVPLVVALPLASLLSRGNPSYIPLSTPSHPMQLVVGLCRSWLHRSSPLMSL